MNTLLLIAALASAAEFVIGREGPFTITADQPPQTTLTGDPAVPPGTSIHVRGECRRFKVLVTSPKGFSTAKAKREWTGTLEEPGGYRLQVGRETQSILSPVDIVVRAPDPEACRPCVDEPATPDTSL